MTRVNAWPALAALASVAVLNAAVVGSEPWPFHPGSIEPQGALAFLVRLAHERWNPGLLRTLDVVVGAALVPVAVVACFRPRWRVRVLATLCVGVLVLLLLPPVALQVGLRESTAPWFFVNDSTYQIELAGDLVRHGESPYSHDFGRTGLERFYGLDGRRHPASGSNHVALRHFAYPPGAALVASAWRGLPAPLDDIRWLVALASLGLLGAALLFPGPLELRLAAGVAAAGNPLVVRSAWFGNADAVTLLLIVVAFALCVRRKNVGAAVALAAALSTKQFALVAIPFLGVLMKRGRSPSLAEPATAFTATLAGVFLPFLLVGPLGLWDDVVVYGAKTYPIVGCGLAHLLVHLHVLDASSPAYPFLLLAAVVWVPLTLILVVAARRRADEPWLAGVGFTASLFALLFLARVFQPSYLVYPLTGVVLTGLLALDHVPER